MNLADIPGQMEVSMKDLPDLSTIIQKLDSDDIETQVVSIEQAAKIVAILAEAAVVALEKEGPQRLLIAERLPRFGSLIVPDLEKLFNKADDSEVQILSALVLLYLGSKIGTHRLLEAFWESGEYTCLIARHLSKSDVIAGEEVVQRLRQCQSSEIDLIICLLYILEDTNHDLPPDILARFSAPDADWRFREIIKRWRNNTNKSE